MQTKSEIRRWLLFISLAPILLLAGCASGAGPKHDEAMRAGQTADSFHFGDYDDARDYFHAMDQTKSGPLSLTHNQIIGRNMWIVWTGGDDRLWDVLGWKSFGTFDLLKTISSHGNLLKFGRHNRWNYLGVVNEPCFEEAAGPDPNPSRFDLWLDKRVAPSAACPADPFEDEAKYPGVKIGARGTTFKDGKTLPVGSFYGYATGIVGLRLFPNPDFDQNAEKAWDANKFYNDPAYYNRKDLIRPFRVGMSCAFCHVGPNPLKPPTDPNSPAWENLSSNVGAQYFWFSRIFAWQADPSALIFQVLQTYEPGALDTSLVSTDYIDNPRTMNAVYYLGPRLTLAQRWGHETLGGGSVHNKQFNDFPASAPNGPSVDPSLNAFFEPPVNVLTPRVLKDGSDSVGVLGALNRVYLNIGLYSEEWLRHFNALFGGQKTTPIEIVEARKNSTYWNTTEKWTPAMADFFLHSTEPHRLADAPGGAQYLSTDPALLQRGKEVFAERCARCHSSKAPQPAQGVDPGGCSGPDYMNCWNAYWTWTKTGDFKTKMRAIVMQPDFLDQNYLSSELRVPVTLTQTNACSPFASNAIGGSIWDNFSSQTYKDLPSVGTITYYHPETGKPNPFPFTTPAGGRGYTRPASLVSLWATAPYLLNNTVGKFNPNPSVVDRIDAFNDGIDKMLNPEKRDKDLQLDGTPSALAAALGNLPSKVYRTTAESYIRIPSKYLPKALSDFLKLNKPLLGSITDSEGLKIGPIPAGMPVGLLASLDLDPGEKRTPQDILKRIELFPRLLKLAGMNLNAMSPAERKQHLVDLADVLLPLSKCPDLIVNRGHYFGTNMLDPAEKETGLSQADKTALIAFLKTF